MQSILISFIVPMYNSAKYIKNCLDSINEQGIPKDSYEVIVIDDGSVDGGGRIARGYERVVYNYQENQGQSVARNTGINMARGKYLCFVDSDDMMVPNTLSFVLDVAIKYDLDVVAYNMLEGTESELCQVETRKTNKIGTIMSGYEYIEKYNFNNGPCWYIFRKDILGDLCFVNGRYAEDGMFTMSLLMKAKSIVHIDNVCYYYIRRTSSTTTKRGINHIVKTIDDYYFAYQYMTKLVYDNKHLLSSGGMERCVSRKMTYIFFLLVRLLYVPKEIWEEWYERITSEKLLPIEQPYSGLKFKIVTFVINNRAVFSISRFVIYNYLQLVRNRSL